MSELAITAEHVRKCYRLYRQGAAQVLDALGVARLFYWGRNYYENFEALNDISLRIPKGQRLGIIGRNGAGKSTLLKLITGTLVPNGGSIQVDGQVQALMELGTGFHPELTGRQNIHTTLSYQRISSAEISEVEEEIITFAEIGDFIDQPVKTYSSGMYARLGFSAATCTNPEILIIDEILGTGDAYFNGKCIARMKQKANENKTTLLYVSHDMPSVLAMCDRAIWIERGEICFDGDPLDAVRAYYQKLQEDERNRETPATTNNYLERGLSGSIVTWKTPDPSITSVRLFDDQQRPMASLIVGDDLIVEIGYRAEKQAKNPVFAMTIYRSDGTNMIHANTVVQGPDVAEIEGEGTVRFVFHPCYLGPGDYAVECSIFEYLDPRSVSMPPYYDQHDRCYRFQVRNTPGMALDLGIVRNPCVIEHLPKTLSTDSC